MWDDVVVVDDTEGAANQGGRIATWGARRIIKSYQSWNMMCF